MCHFPEECPLIPNKSATNISSNRQSILKNEDQIKENQRKNSNKRFSQPKISTLRRTLSTGTGERTNGFSTKGVESSMNSYHGR